MRYCAIDEDLMQLSRVECSYGYFSGKTEDKGVSTFSWLVDHEFALNGFQLVDKIMHAYHTEKSDDCSRAWTIQTYYSPRTSKRLPLGPIPPITTVCFEFGALACRVSYESENFVRHPSK
jgi:hypothetical protein